MCLEYWYSENIRLYVYSSFTCGCSFDFVASREHLFSGCLFALELVHSYLISVHMPASRIHALSLSVVWESLRYYHHTIRRRRHIASQSNTYYAALPIQSFAKFTPVVRLCRSFVTDIFFSFLTQVYYFVCMCLAASGWYVWMWVCECASQVLLPYVSSHYEYIMKVKREHMDHNNHHPGSKRNVYTTNVYTKNCI